MKSWKSKVGFFLVLSMHDERITVCFKKVKDTIPALPTDKLIRTEWSQTLNFATQLRNDKQFYGYPCITRNYIVCYIQLINTGNYCEILVCKVTRIHTLFYFVFIIERNTGKTSLHDYWHYYIDFSVMHLASVKK